MRALFLVPLALVACKETNPDFCPAHPDDPRCGGTGHMDAAVDGREIDGDPGIDARACFGADNYEVCLTSVPSNPVTLPASFDTGTGNTMCLATQPAGWASRGQPPSCFVVGTNIMVSTSNVTGPRPLVLLATGNITVDGVLDVASHGGASPKTGPGAPFANCQNFLSAPTASTSGGAGGAGATFITKGANGGDGNGGQAGNTGGATPGPLGTNPTALRAGCSGQKGADGDTGAGGGTGGAGGVGGGAVLLLAGSKITITQNGIINASGAGGAAGGDQAGGGGGGSGGMIYLYAATISAPSGRMLANGGGGASGANNGGGNPGNDPSPTNPQSAAGTVAGPQSSGTGGSGWAINLVAIAGTAGAATFSGAGGGGGGGFIESNVPVDSSANTSPSVTTP